MLHKKEPVRFSRVDVDWTDRHTNTQTNQILIYPFYIHKVCFLLLISKMKIKIEMVYHKNSWADDFDESWTLKESKSNKYRNVDQIYIYKQVESGGSNIYI